MGGALLIAYVLPVEFAVLTLDPATKSPRAKIYKPSEIDALLLSPTSYYHWQTQQDHKNEEKLLQPSLLLEKALQQSKHIISFYSNMLGLMGFLGTVTETLPCVNGSFKNPAV